MFYFSTSLKNASRVVKSNSTGTFTKIVLESIFYVATKPGYFKPFVVSNKANFKFLTCNPFDNSSS